MIEILTGSHWRNSEHNKEQFDKINDLLLDKKNPLFKKFNEGQYSLDDCDGFIGIRKTSYLDKDLTEKQLIKLKQYLKKYIKYEGFLYVGSSILNF